MSGTVWCDECESRIRSQIHREPIDGVRQYCAGCTQRIRQEELTPGEDFEPGELWTTEEGDDA